MANQEHLDILKQGAQVWNRWWHEHADIQPDLGKADLSGANLAGVELNGAWLDETSLEHANLSRANLQGAILRGANLHSIDFSHTDLRHAELSGSNLSHAVLDNANLERTDLRHADLSLASLRKSYLDRADLSEANLTGADLTGASLIRADLWTTNFREADLTGADLRHATLVETNLAEATLTNCYIHGTAAWKVNLEGATQNNLVITAHDEPIITVDNFKIAQFVYLLLNNAEIREVIDTITSKVVLILGRFTPERKAVLDALKEELRKHNYSPVLFDFEKPASRDLTGTISTLAHLARFIVVDLTDPSSAPHEVATVIPQTIVPVQPLLSQEPLLVNGKVIERRAYSMFKDLQRRYHWVLPTYAYTDQAHLLATLQERVIAPAEQKAQELAKQ
jgi:uncharacterized protein YjbI with pentapeptide repeats